MTRASFVLLPTVASDKSGTSSRHNVVIWAREELGLSHGDRRTAKLHWDGLILCRRRQSSGRMTWTASFEAQSPVINRFGTATTFWPNADNETGHIDAEWSRPFLGFFNQLNWSLQLCNSWMDRCYAMVINDVLCSAVLKAISSKRGDPLLYSTIVNRFWRWQSPSCQMTKIMDNAVHIA